MLILQSEKIFYEKTFINIFCVSYGIHLTKLFLSVNKLKGRLLLSKNIFNPKVFSKIETLPLDVSFITIITNKLVSCNKFF